MKDPIKGKVFKVLEKQVFSENFEKKTIVITTEKEYNPLIAVDFCNKNINRTVGIKEGDSVSVWIDVFSKAMPSNPEKFFNNITGWKIEKQEENVSSHSTFPPSFR